MLFPTTLVGSLPQPDWLIDHSKLAGTFPPRVRARELWRVPAEFLAEAQDDATLTAIKMQEDAGIDILTDGEMRRESYSNHFATALDGLDLANPAIVVSRAGRPNPVPRIVGELARKAPICVADLAFLKRHTQRRVKITVPGPFTMSAQAKNEFYASDAAAALAYGRVLNGEIRDLFAAGADVVQIDEPYMQASPQRAEEYGLDALNAALAGITGTTAVHICFGYAALVQQRPSGYSFLPQLARCSCRQVALETAQSALDLSILTELPGKNIILGVIDLGDMQIETSQIVAARIRRALPFVAAENIVVAPDCGMKYLPRDVAAGKLTAMVEGARILRREIGGTG